VNQTDQVREHLEQHGSITPLEALREYGIMRLSARIHQLRQRGVAIDAKMQLAINRKGAKVHFARYSVR
jgi:hypothetical protein